MSRPSPEALERLREIAEANRPPPLWEPKRAGETVIGIIEAARYPLRGSASLYTLPDGNQIDVRQVTGELITVQIYGRMGHDLAVADAGIDSLIRIEYLGKFPGWYGRGRYRKFLIAVLND